MPQKVVPIADVDLPEGKEYGWKVIVENGIVVAFENAQYGRFERVAFVDADSGDFLYDGIRKFDGPRQEDGHATPGAIMVVVEECSDGYYLHCQEESRPIIFDHINGVQGVVVVGFAGGFSKKGEKPSETALKELLEEQGVKVEKASVEMIGYASDNRATTETCIEVYLGKFSIKVDAKPGEHEEILKTNTIRVDQFDLGHDGIVNSAYAMAVHYLGCISPIPGEPPENKELADLRKQIEKLEIELAVKPSLKRGIRNLLKRLMERFEE